MTRTEAGKIIKRRNKVRRELDKWQDACWKTSPARDSFKVYQQRYRDAAKELEDNVGLHREALSVFLGGGKQPAKSHSAYMP